jgi:hypothetical protein
MQMRDRLRLPSPAPQPQALAADGEHVWLGSWQSGQLYGLNQLHGTVFEQNVCPGRPVSAVAIGGELRMVCSEETDSRFIRRYIPGRGFKEHERFQCPDDTGSFLAYDGTSLWLSQRANKRVLQLDASYGVRRVVDIGSEIIGVVWVAGVLYLSTWWGARTGGCKIMRWRDGETPTVVAEVPFAGISLAHDGRSFWTNAFKNDEIVAFNLE